MIDFDKFSIFSVMGKEAGKQTEQEYSRTVLNKYDKFLSDIKKAKEELENNERPNVKRKLDNVDDYDVIYIGGPVWWSHYPMAIFTALEGLDFTGKKIKPFTTHEGSGIGSVMEDIRKICKNAVIEDAIAFRGSDAKLCEDKIKNWI